MFHFQHTAISFFVTRYLRHINSIRSLQSSIRKGYFALDHPAAENGGTTFLSTDLNHRQSTWVLVSLPTPFHSIGD